MHSILIIGGTGVFGKRLVRHLANMRDVTIFVSSRSAVKAYDFIKTLSNTQAELCSVALDTEVDLCEQLENLKPSVVVDCSGPFQSLGYRTAVSVLNSGAHFVDLADARDYLVGFADALDERARKNGVCAFSGASSTPTLSTCAVRHLTIGWKQVDTVDMSITPAGRSEVGPSVIEAILSYAGKDVPIWLDGTLKTTTGWLRAKSIDIPGLGIRRVAAVETFDAEYLGPHLKVASRVSFSAGLESRIEQLGIETIAALRKRKIIRSAKALIPVLLKARQITRIPTSKSGGMMVEVSGCDADGASVQAKWSLVAHQDHGPNIPILPVAAVVKKLMSGSVKPCADFAHSILTLADIELELQRYDIEITNTLIKTKSVLSC